MTRCESRSKRGTRCKAAAIKGTKHCLFHVEKRRKLVEKVKRKYR